MALQRLLRCDDRASLAQETAALLLTALAARQERGGSASLCLTGGPLANEVLDQFALQAPGSALNASALHLWWNWDYFIATDNPERNSLQALSRLAGALPLDPSKIHPIPSQSATSDPEAGAAQYAQELKEAAPIDICLLEVGLGGQVAGIFPRHLDPPLAALAAGISDAPLPHPQLVTLTRAGLNTCREIWVLASGTVGATQLKQVAADDPTLPATYLNSAEPVLWLVDDTAAAALPYHRCSL